MEVSELIFITLDSFSLSKIGTTSKLITFIVLQHGVVRDWNDMERIWQVL